MSLAIYIAGVMVVLALGYLLYGRTVARHYRLDDASPTPATTVNDGVDYVPTGKWYLLFQHFSAISAAGPIAGPIMACLAFGWGPSILWILLGVIFIGAVHDFSSLIASVRHRACSIAEIVRDNLGRSAYIAILIFLWLSLIYVIIAFTDITANTFVGKDAESGIRQEGAVATASTLYLILAVAMGLCQRFLKMPLWLATAIFVPGILVVVWLGTQYPIVLGVSHPAMVWGILILLYCGLASVAPLWSLLQPRGYLGGFVLVMAIAVGVIGLLFGGFPIEQEAFKGWYCAPKDMSLFPVLFVTIACGACSGFHGLVCSGTTSKQIAVESHTRPIGYGAMLLEAFVAAIALATVMIVAPGAPSAAPGIVYGNGIGRFLTVVIGPDHYLFAATFGAMAFSTFVFDTLDVCTRLGRYIIQELFGWKGRGGAFVATVMIMVVPMTLLIVPQDPKDGPAYLKFWTLFGASNQLLAALTLMVVTVWLIRQGKNFWFTLFPMLFMFVITLWSLGLIAWNGLRAVEEGGWSWGPVVLNGMVATALIAISLYLIVEAIRSIVMMSRRSAK